QDCRGMAKGNSGGGPMTEARRKRNRGGAKFRAELRAWLMAQNTPPDDVTELVYNLSDIRDSCGALLRLIEQLPKCDPQTRRGRQQVATTFGELFEHLSPHLRA